MTYEKRLEQTSIKIDQADAIVIGAGAGLSASAGLLYSGKRFEDNFPDFIEKYHMTDMYSSGFYPFPTEEERWAYWSRHIILNRWQGEAGQVYKDLFKLAEKKKHFVLTTNVDGQFIKTGFSPERVFATQGDYGKNQCSKKCHNTLYDNKELVEKMIASQEDCRIPSELVPLCPVCGGPMDPNLRKDNYFVEDENWHKSSKNYSDFIQSLEDSNILFMELGVGYNTPAIIKYPFEQMTNHFDRAFLIRMNKDYPQISEINREKTIVFSEDISAIFDKVIEISQKK